MNHVPPFASLSAVAVTGPYASLHPVLFALDFAGRAWTREGTNPWRLVPPQTTETEETP